LAAQGNPIPASDGVPSVAVGMLRVLPLATQKSR
jgi:hypothetical protein